MSVQRLACLGLILLFAAACTDGELTTPAPSPTLPATSSAAGMPLTRAPAAMPTPSIQPIESPQATPGPAWQVETLLVAPGDPGRLFALVKDSSGPLWGFSGRRRPPDDQR